MDRRKVTNSEMKEAISRSGYLIEQRVIRVLNQKDYFVETNWSYVDPVTAKTRELDILAHSVISTPDPSDLSLVVWTLFCECENNMQPVVFFPTEPFDIPSETLKRYGIPLKIWLGDNYTDLLTFLRLSEFHHYFQSPATIPVATQYCSFAKVRRRDREKWIATGLEEQHDTFNSLVWAVEHGINESCCKCGIFPEENRRIADFNLEFAYPLVILGGELMQAQMGKRGLVLKKVKHIRFLKNLYSSGKLLEYQIDVITEDYMSEYSSMVSKEMNQVAQLLTRHRKIITESTDRIVGGLRGAKPETFYETLRSP